MLKIFKYKKMYFEVCNDLANINIMLDSAKSEIKDLKVQIKEEQEKLECYLEEHKFNYLRLLDTSNKKIEEKEKLRRQNAGKVGALQKKINLLEDERTQMMDLINGLISENQKLNQEKKKTTIDDLRRYFKKY